MCTSRAAKRAPSSTEPLLPEEISSLLLGAMPRDERQHSYLHLEMGYTSTPAHPNVVFRSDSLLLRSR